MPAPADGLIQMAGRWQISYFSEEAVEQGLLRYAVIVTSYQDQWVFVRQKTRLTYELPAGRRETAESIEETARRELWEETGALEYILRPVCAFHVGEQYVSADQLNDQTPCGMLYTAQVTRFGDIPAASEISEKIICSQFPEPLSYPDVQPELFQMAQGDSSSVT